MAAAEVGGRSEKRGYGASAAGIGKGAAAAGGGARVDTAGRRSEAERVRAPVPRRKRGRTKAGGIGNCRWVGRKTTLDTPGGME